MAHGSGEVGRYMAVNKFFFPQQALDTWVVAGTVDLNGPELLLKDEGRRYRLTEGVRVTSEVTGEPDVHELVGRCKTLDYLRELGADILEGSMIIDENAYDIMPGFLGTPMDKPASLPPSRDGTMSDEDLLAQFLAKNM